MAKEFTVTQLTDAIAELLFARATCPDLDEDSLIVAMEVLKEKLENLPKKA